MAKTADLGKIAISYLRMSEFIRIFAHNFRYGP